MKCKHFNHKNNNTYHKYKFGTLFELVKKNMVILKLFFKLKIFVLPSENIIPILLENVDNIILMKCNYFNHQNDSNFRNLHFYNVVLLCELP